MKNLRLIVQVEVGYDYSWIVRKLIVGCTSQWQAGNLGTGARRPWRIATIAIMLKMISGTKTLRKFTLKRVCEVGLLRLIACVEFGC